MVVGCMMDREVYHDNEDREDVYILSFSNKQKEGCHVRSKSKTMPVSACSLVKSSRRPTKDLILSHHLVTIKVVVRLAVSYQDVRLCYQWFELACQ